MITNFIKTLPFLTLIIASCSKPIEHKITRCDNSDKIQNATSTYEKTSNLEYKYDFYEEIEDKTSLHYMEMSSVYNEDGNSEIILDKTFEDFKCELPQKNIAQRKYAVILADSYSMLLTPTFNSSELYFATDSFLESFDEFLKNVKYEKSDENVKDYAALYVYTADISYTLCTSGRLKVNFTDGEYISIQKFDTFKMVLEVMNMYSYLEPSMTPFDYFLETIITLKYDGAEKELRTLQEVFGKKVTYKSHRSFLINSRVFDYTKMLEISFVEHDITSKYYMTIDGLIVHERNPFMIHSSSVLHYLSSEDYCIYECYHIVGIDASKIFALFEE